MAVWNPYYDLMSYFKPGELDRDDIEKGIVKIITDYKKNKKLNNWRADALFPSDKTPDTYKQYIRGKKTIDINDVHIHICLKYLLSKKDITITPNLIKSEFARVYVEKYIVGFGDNLHGIWRAYRFGNSIDSSKDSISINSQIRSFSIRFVPDGDRNRQFFCGVVKSFGGEGIWTGEFTFEGDVISIFSSAGRGTGLRSGRDINNTYCYRKRFDQMDVLHGISLGIGYPSKDRLDSNGNGLTPIVASRLVMRFDSDATIDFYIDPEPWCSGIGDKYLLKPEYEEIDLIKQSGGDEHIKTDLITRFLLPADEGYQWGSERIYVQK